MANKEYKKVVNQILDELKSKKPEEKPVRPKQPPKETPKKPKPFERIPEKKDPSTKTDPSWPEKD